ncbi:peptide ABC transporter substrate-binding protein [Acetivibrio cellulolyticus]|uniref:peptide ABC transporter substrate-binding protein n=1 Tax=Acetivibrio cellulolyticus TaxID=35830 RepID=UPI0001E30186|nr:peptide ABC transporter substrate-binding protein [Acetivibrio cellulolyticus]
MRFNKGILVLIIFLMCFSMFFTGCNTKEAVLQEISISLGGEPQILDPQLVTDVIPMRVVNAVFEGLCRKDKEGIPMPGVAKSWDISEDKLVYTFHLREARWADGSQITATDFKEAWLRALDPKPADHQPALLGYLLLCIEGAEQYSYEDGKKEAVGIEAKDDKTLVVKLKQPTPYFLDLVCSSVFMPVNMKFYGNQPLVSKISTYGAEAQNILGNGPFAIKEWNHGQNIVLEKNENYWNEENIKLDKVNFRVIADNSSAITSFKAGEIDVVSITEAHQIDELKANGDKVENYNVGATQYISINNADPLLKNENLRRAIALGIDRKNLVDKVVKDGSKEALGFVNPVVRGVDKAFRDETGDLFRGDNTAEAESYALKSLVELGLKDMPKLTLLVEDMETSKRDAQAIQEMWRKNLGMEVEIQTMSFESIQDKMMQKDYQMALLMWSGDYNDPTSFLEIFETENYFNVAGYNNPDFDSILSNARKETDDKKRMNLLSEAEKLLFKSMPICPLYYIYNSYALKPDVKGFLRGSSAIQDIELYWTYIE